MVFPLGCARGGGRPVRWRERQWHFGDFPEVPLGGGVRVVGRAPGQGLAVPPSVDLGA